MYEINSLSGNKALVGLVRKEPKCWIDRCTK